MNHTHPLRLLPLLLALASMTQAAPYSAERKTVDGYEVIRLADDAHRLEVSIVPAIGNTAYDLRSNGKRILYFPFQSLAEWKAKPTLIGVPFLAPWANRLDAEGFYANGKHYRLNPELNNFRKDGNGKPIHGLVTYTDAWRVKSLQANDREATVTSRLEFWRRPDWMAQFPFAHAIEMTYKLRDGALEVETAIENLASEAMPVAIGFHPYFQLPDTPRDKWQVTIPAREHVVVSKELIPTGDRQPRDAAEVMPLAGRQFDDVYTGLVRQGGKALFIVKGAKEQIAVEYGPHYPVGVVYAPPGRDFICFEPMAGLTNAFNLAHEGKYPDLQTVAPGGTWRESYWIRPSGF